MEQYLSRQFSRKKFKCKIKKAIDDSQSNEEDERFVALAVAFVIKNSCKGLVSLCTSVAELLREKDRLQRENADLNKEVVDLRCKAVEAPLKNNPVATQECSSDNLKCESVGMHRSDSGNSKNEAVVARSAYRTTEKLLEAPISEPTLQKEPSHFQPISIEVEQSQCACTMVNKEGYSSWHELKQAESLERRKVLMPLGELKKLLQLANTYLSQKSSQRTAEASTRNSLYLC